MSLCDTVFAVITAELGEEGHRGLGALGDEFAEHPVHRLTERRPLRRQLRGGNRSRTSESSANQRV